MLLTLRDLCKSYQSGDKRADVLRGVSLDLAAGQSLALMGESGSGKSTLLHLVGGLDVPDSGVISIRGTQMSTTSDAARAQMRCDAIGIVFQQFNLIPSLTVQSNIAFQAQMAGRFDAAWCATLAARMGLTAHLTKYPEALSGGQQQRVAIARALAARPALLLADEPTGNLDEATATTVLDLMLEISGETQTALLMVTHSERHARKLGATLVLENGRIAA